MLYYHTCRHDEPRRVPLRYLRFDKAALLVFFTFPNSQSGVRVITGFLSQPGQSLRLRFNFPVVFFSGYLYVCEREKTSGRRQQRLRARTCVCVRVRGGVIEVKEGRDWWLH